MISDTDEHPGGRDMCGMWEGALSFHAFSRTATLPVPPCVHQPRSSPNSILSSGFLWRLHHTDMINYYINSFSSPSPLWRTCGEAENTKPSNLDFVFLLCHLAHSLGFYGNGVIQVQFSSLPFSHVRLFATPWTAAHQASQSITNSQSLLKLMSIKSVIPSNHLILCHPLLLLPSIFLSIWVFSNESVLCIRWPKYWSFSVSPSNEYSGLISFRIDWFDLLAVQGTLKSLLQHHSSKASILQCPTFFIVLLSLNQSIELRINLADIQFMLDKGAWSHRIIKIRILELHKKNFIENELNIREVNITFFPSDLYPCPEITLTSFRWEGRDLENIPG